MENDFLESRHSYWTILFFNLYLKFQFLKYFSRIQFEFIGKENEDPPRLNHPLKSILLISNHFSWWDALIIYHWNQNILRKKFHCMVLRDTLIKNPSLRKVGGYSVNPGKRSVIKSLQYTVERLKSPENSVLLFPQGELLSGHIAHIGFEPGLSRIMENQNEEVEIIFLAGFMDHFAKKKPEITFYMARQKTKTQYPGLETDYNAFYSQARIKQGERNS